jgi:hypothetical protein
VFAAIGLPSTSPPSSTTAQQRDAITHALKTHPIDTTAPVHIKPGGRHQPSVDWSFDIAEHATGRHHDVSGHVEIRWSHGKLNGSPEAKVYLDTDPLDVPGYDPI